MTITTTKTVGVRYITITINEKPKKGGEQDPPIDPSKHLVHFPLLQPSNSLLDLLVPALASKALPSVSHKRAEPVSLGFVLVGKAVLTLYSARLWQINQLLLPRNFQRSKL
jgi:hypothetical protein